MKNKKIIFYPVVIFFAILIFYNFPYKKFYKKNEQKNEQNEKYSEEIGDRREEECVGDVHNVHNVHNGHNGHKKTEGWYKFGWELGRSALRNITVGLVTAGTMKAIGMIYRRLSGDRQSVSPPPAASLDQWELLSTIGDYDLARRIVDENSYADIIPSSELDGIGDFLRGANISNHPKQKMIDLFYASLNFFEKKRNIQFDQKSESIARSLWVAFIKNTPSEEREEDVIGKYLTLLSNSNRFFARPKKNESSYDEEDIPFRLNIDADSAVAL